MVDQADALHPEAGLFPASVGERLRLAREASALDLNDVAAKTRVPMRHLEAIERSDYASMPSVTYAIGFAKSYARAVGADVEAIASDLRIELGRSAPGQADTTPYEPIVPARVPSKLLAWTAVAIAVLLGLAYWAWRSDRFAGAPPFPVAVEVPEVPEAEVEQEPVAAPSPGGQVVLTAIQNVWLRVYDKDNKRLIEREMLAGERYEVPMDAVEPRILTGRPESIKVTVDGREVAPLGDAERTIKDVGVSAAALAARPAATAAPITPVRERPRL